MRITFLLQLRDQDRARWVLISRCLGCEWHEDGAFHYCRFFGHPIHLNIIQDCYGQFGDWLEHGNTHFKEIL